MADFEHRDNSGSLFVNSRKTKDSHPDRNGDGKIKCPCCDESFMIRMSGWVKEGRAGKQNWLSVAFTPEEAEGGEQPRTASHDRGEQPAPMAAEPSKPLPIGAGRGSASGFSDMGDDIPFVVSLLEHQIDVPKTRRMRRASFV